MARSISVTARVEEPRLAPLTSELPCPLPSRRARGPRVRNAFFRDMVASLRNGVVCTSRDGRVVFINDEACRTLGVRRGVHVGRPVGEVLGASPDVVRILASAFELSQLPNRAELRIKGTNKVIGYTLCQVHDPRGHVTGAALLFKDLTRVEQLEERERLRDRLAALGEMAAAIAHEVKNPLGGIEITAGLLRRRVPDTNGAHGLLNDIIDDAKMANAIVVEVLEFVRPIRLEVEPVSLRDVIAEAAAATEGLRASKSIDLDLAADVNDLPSIEGDAHQLRQLFTNLLTNASEAIDGAGRVVVRGAIVRGADDSYAAETVSVPAMVVVEVTDDGPGVPEEIRDRIFSPFFTTKPRGSGLGLPIVRRIVDAHDGRIDLQVGTGGGTTVRVTLPVTRTRDEAGNW